MAETGSKIFDLDALTDIADDDVLVEVDVSDTTDSADGTNKKITVRDLLGVLNNGWIPAEETWAYASETTITVPTGAGSVYRKGMPFKLTANSVELQGYVVSVADTVLTVTGDALTNHTYTENYYAKTGTVPQDFTDWLDEKFYAYLSATQLNLVNGAETQIELDTEDYDIGSNFSIVTHKFTAPITGYYDVRYQVGFQSIVADHRYLVYVYNGENIALLISEMPAISGNGLYTSGGGDLYLEKGDTIDLRAESESGDDTVDVIGANTYATFLSVSMKGI